MNLSSNLIDDSKSVANFLYKLLLTDKQVSRLRKAFANGSSANIKSSKILKIYHQKLPKIIHLGFSLLGAIRLLDFLWVVTNSILASKEYRIFDVKSFFKIQYVEK